MQALLAGGSVAAGRLTTAQNAAPAATLPLPPPDDSGRPVDAPPPGYYAYRGTSGPGFSVTDASAAGGWVSGGPGVRYQGPRPMPYPTLPWQADATGSAVTTRLIPPIRPLLDVQIRDTIICLGGNGLYYMTGSTGDNIWKFNEASSCGARRISCAGTTWAWCGPSSATASGRNNGVCAQACHIARCGRRSCTIYVATTSSAIR
jgi:hypothetical protein